MTVTFMAILRGFRKPDGLLCHYPVFSIDENRFFPSHLLAVDEEFFSACFLKFAMACFNRRRAEQTNPLMSPIHAPQELIKQLPPWTTAQPGMTALTQCPVLKSTENPGSHL